MPSDTVFSTVPYAAALAMAAGFLLRYLIGSRRGDDLRAEAVKAVQLFRGDASWRYGLALLLLGHLAALLFPRHVLAWNGTPWRLLLLEGTGFLVGAWTLLGAVALLHQHLREPHDRPAGSMMDFTLVGLLFAQIVSGLAMAGLYRWASSWSAVTVTPYLQSLFRLEPLPALVAHMPYLVKLHLVLTMAVLAVLPWTQLAYLLLFPLDRALGLVLAPIERLADGAGPHLAQLRSRTLAAAAYWWEDED